MSVVRVSVVPGGGGQNVSGNKWVGYVPIEVGRCGQTMFESR